MDTQNKEQYDKIKASLQKVPDMVLVVLLHSALEQYMKDPILDNKMELGAISLAFGLKVMDFLREEQITPEDFAKRLKEKLNGK